MSGVTAYETRRRSIFQQIGTEGIDPTVRTAVLDVFNRAVDRPSTRRGRWCGAGCVDQ